MGEKREIDWEAVEMQYRSGIRSLKDIGAEFGVSDAGIIKRAKRDGWARDLAAKIQAKAEAKVSASLVSAEVSEMRTLTEKAVVDAGAEAVARVRISQRTDIQRSRKLAMELMEELESDSGELPRRVDCMKKLSETLKTLVGLEREAFGILAGHGSGDDDGSNPVRGTSFVIVRP